MKNLGHFNEESIALFKEYFEGNVNFAESTEEFLDFGRCQRSDGSFYGTSGQCRKGKETGARKEESAASSRSSKTQKAIDKASPEQLERLKNHPKVTPAQKKVLDKAIAEKTKPESEVGYKPKSKGSDSGPSKVRQIKDAIREKIGLKREDDIENIGFKDKNEINRMFDDRIQDIYRNTGGGPGTEKALKRNEESRQKALKSHDANKKFAADLKKEMPKGFKATMDPNNSEIVMSKKVGRHDVEVRYSPSSGFNYRVNGKYDAGSVTDRKEQIRIATSVREAWDSVVRASPEGQKFNTSAYDGDGKADQRVKAYKKIGFGDPNEVDQMYAVKKGGRVVPSSEQDGNAQYLVNFTEDDMNEAWLNVVFPMGKEDTGENPKE